MYEARNPQDAGSWYIFRLTERAIRHEINLEEYRDAWRSISRIKRIREKSLRDRAWERGGELVRVIRGVLRGEGLKELAR